MTSYRPCPAVCHHTRAQSPVMSYIHPTGPPQIATTQSVGIKSGLSFASHLRSARRKDTSPLPLLLVAFIDDVHQPVSGSERGSDDGEPDHLTAFRQSAASALRRLTSPLWTFVPGMVCQVRKALQPLTQSRRLNRWAIGERQKADTPAL